MLHGTSILLIIGGGIAAYKSLELIREVRKRGGRVKAIVTRAGKEFVTPLSIASLTGEKVYEDLWSLTDEVEMGHIQLSRAADLIVAAPATADLMAKMATGQANDLATTTLLATDKRVLLAPAMNVRMWHHPATQRNLATLRADGALIVGPNEGEMACGEFGLGRMAEPLEIVAAIEAALQPAAKPLAGRHVLITSGPTHEPIDPVRYIANRSSGKQGHAIARAAAAAGARVTLVSGPVALPDPAGAHVVRVTTAREMLAAVEAALPADIAVFAAGCGRLAGGGRGQGQDQEEGRRSAPGAGHGREPGHPEDHRPAQGRPARAGGRLRGGDRGGGRQREGQAFAQGLRPDRRQRRLDGVRHSGRGVRRRRQRRAPRFRRRNRELAGRVEGRDRAAACRTSRRHGRKLDVMAAEMIPPENAGKAPVLRFLRLPHARNLPLPAYATAGAAGLDLCAALPEGGELTLAFGERALVPTGFALQLPEGFEAQVRPRSGLAARFGLTVLNSPGTVDADYRGEIKVLLIHLGREPVTLRRGDRIAQLVAAPVAQAVVVEAEELDGTARGAGGFGSTGIAP